GGGSISTPVRGRQRSRYVYPRRRPVGAIWRVRLWAADGSPCSALSADAVGRAFGNGICGRACVRSGCASPRCRVCVDCADLFYRDPPPGLGKQRRHSVRVFSAAQFSAPTRMSALPLLFHLWKRQLLLILPPV